MQYYSAPASEAKNWQFFQIELRKWPFILIKSQIFEKLHKINILNKVIIYNIPKYHDISILFAAARACSVSLKSAKFFLYFVLLRAILLDPETWEALHAACLENIYPFLNVASIKFENKYFELGNYLYTWVSWHFNTFCSSESVFRLYEIHKKILFILSYWEPYC